MDYQQWLVWSLPKRVLSPSKWIYEIMYIKNENKKNVLIEDGEYCGLSQVISFLQKIYSNKDKTMDESLINQIPNIIEIIEKREREINNITTSLSFANAKSAELIAEEENRNKQLAIANANAAELMAEIELKNDKIQKLNKSLAKANAEASELIIEIESKKEELEKAHEELNILNKHLEEKVQERTAEIQHLLFEKDEFINELSHDLRTPLTPLINLIPMLKKNEQDPKQLELFEIIINNVDRIHRVVKKTVRIATLNAPSFQINKERTNLADKINNIISNLEYDNQKYQIINNISENTQTLTDGELLKDLFNNLVDNAIKFSPDGGTITINAIPRNNKIQVSISDPGIGLSEKELICVFDDFYKADWSRHDLCSSGLGLTICKKIIEKHDGKIWAESKGHGKGSTFYFTLPSIVSDEFLTISEDLDKINNNLNNKLG